jgi:hypothetical protein
MQAAPTGAPTDGDWAVTPSDVAYGKPLYGYDEGAVKPGLGSLIALANGMDLTVDSVSTAISSPVFAWGHHHGIWVGQGETDFNLFGATGATVKVWPKAVHKDTTQQLLTVAVVYSAGAAATLTVTGSGSAAGTATIALPIAANPTLAEATAETLSLVCSTETAGDLAFTITTNQNWSADDWAIIHTVTVWPIW